MSSHACQVPVVHFRDNVPLLGPALGGKYGPSPQSCATTFLMVLTEFWCAIYTRIHAVRARVRFASCHIKRAKRSALRAERKCQ